MEVICVDDASLDSSLSVLRNYAKCDSRIKIIHKSINEGLVAARKTGIEHAIGDYIGYVDGDDWIENNMFSELLSYAEDYSVDIVTSGMIYEKGSVGYACDGFEEGLYEGDRLEYIKSHILYSKSNELYGIRPNLVNKIFKHNLIEKAQQQISDSVTHGEDRICSMLCVLEANSIYITHNAFYHYIIYKNSMNNGEDISYFAKIDALYNNFRQLYEKENFPPNLRLQCEVYLTEMAMRGINENLGFANRDILWYHHSWMNQIEKGSRIVIYGAGRLGRLYYRQAINDVRRGIEVVSIVDKQYNEKIGGMKVMPPESIKKMFFDYVIIAVTNKDVADSIRKFLIEMEIPDRRILWLDQSPLILELIQHTGCI